MLINVIKNFKKYYLYIFFGWFDENRYEALGLWYTPNKTENMMYNRSEEK